jgi:hypothetical protein
MGFVVMLLSLIRQILVLYGQVFIDIVTLTSETIGIDEVEFDRRKWLVKWSEAVNM